MMNSIQIRDDFIKLGQALKLAGLVDSGVKAKEVITLEKVKLNGVTETRRGKKLVEGDIVEYNGKSFQIASKKM